MFREHSDVPYVKLYESSVVRGPKTPLKGREIHVSLRVFVTVLQWISRPLFLLGTGIFALQYDPPPTSGCPAPSQLKADSGCNQIMARVQELAEFV